MASLEMILAVTCFSVMVCYFAFRRPNSSKLPLPPGPPQLPLIGNLHQAPAKFSWIVYTEWAKTYGPVMYLQYGKDTIIMLSTHEAARDLLDKRSNIYSSRPRVVMGGEIVSRNHRSLFMPYGPQYRNHRRLQSSLVTPTMSTRYTTLQDLESKQLMIELLSASEDNWMASLHRYTASLVYGLNYGKRILRNDAQEVKDIGQVLENFLYAAQVGTWVVDALPILNHLPSFLAPWKRLGAKFHEFESKIALRNLQDGIDREGWNWFKQAMSMKEVQGMSSKEIAYAVNTMYEAGTDTTKMALETFVMSALAYPDEYKIAQQEVDKALTENDFPTFKDRQRLRYVDAIAKEVLRWRPVAASGIPHAVTQNDEYMGYRIPKGAMVISNHWAVDRDQSVYGSDAEEFRPSRFVENPDLPYASFGYGRRVCTGQHIALNSLFVVIARMLWAFNIEHAIAADGTRVGVDTHAYTQGLTSGPLPFKAKFVPRSEKRRQMVEEAWSSQEKNLRVLMDEIEKASGKSA